MDKNQKLRLRLVEICSSCLKASCAQGIDKCDSSDLIISTFKTTYELTKLKLEDSKYWTIKTMVKVYGVEAPFGYSKELTTSAKE